MNVKTSKETTDRQKAAVGLLSVLTLRGPAVAAALAERFGRFEEPAFRSFILGFVGALNTALAELVAADEAHYAEKAELATRRRRRDQATRNLTRLVVGLRRAVVALHVRPDLAGLGFAAETPREPVPLLRQVDRIVETFENGPVGTLLGPPVFDHARLDPLGYPPPLKQEADALREIIDQVALAQRRAEAALDRKRAARDEYDHLFLRAARIFENCCYLVGWTELAARVRPSRRRPGRTEEEPPEEMPEGAAAGAPQVATREPSQGARPDLRRSPAPGRADARRGPAAGARIPWRGDPRHGNADQGVPAAASPGRGFRAAPDHPSGRPKRTLADRPRPLPRGLVQARGHV